MLNTTRLLLWINHIHSKASITWTLSAGSVQPTQGYKACSILRNMCQLNYKAFYIVRVYVHGLKFAIQMLSYFVVLSNIPVV